MKKKILFISLLTSGISFGQTFSDNFDSYVAGQFLASQSNGEWTTWSNLPGSAEDVLVSSADALSGANSLYFETSVMAGGPVDLVRNFGVINSGTFSMDFNIKVETGKAGYFNFQKNAVVGQVWALDCFFNDDGSILINNQAGLNFQGTYSQNVWFNFRINVDLDSNVWEVFTDGVSLGTFSNPENQIASIDFYPTDQNTPFSCGYYIDDFRYTVTPSTANVSKNTNSILGDFEIYPNPAQESTELRFELQQPANVELKVFSIDGKMVNNSNYGLLSNSSNIVMNTSSFDAGMYIVYLIADGKSVQKRLIIE